MGTSALTRKDFSRCVKVGLNSTTHEKYRWQNNKKSFEAVAMRSLLKKALLNPNNLNYYLLVAKTVFLDKVLQWEVAT